MLKDRGSWSYPFPVMTEMFCFPPLHCSCIHLSAGNSSLLSELMRLDKAGSAWGAGISCCGSEIIPRMTHPIPAATQACPGANKCNQWWVMDPQEATFILWARHQPNYKGLDEKCLRFVSYKITSWNKEATCCAIQKTLRSEKLCQEKKGFLKKERPVAIPTKRKQEVQLSLLLSLHRTDHWFSDIFCWRLKAENQKSRFQLLGKFHILHYLLRLLHCAMRVHHLAHVALGFAPFGLTDHMEREAHTRLNS